MIEAFETKAETRTTLGASSFIKNTTVAVSLSLVRLLSTDPIHAEEITTNVPTPTAATSEQAEFFLVGGGPLGKQTGFHDQFAQLATKKAEQNRGRGAKPRLVIFPAATEESHLTPLLRRHWTGPVQQYDAVDVLTPGKLERQEHHQLEIVKGADAAWFSGGNQNHLVKEMGQRPKIMRMIQEKVAAGTITLGGTSAGAVALGERMPTGNPKNPVTKGLGLLPMIFESHVRDQHRQGRLSQYANETNTPKHVYGLSPFVAMHITSTQDGFHGRILGSDPLYIHDPTRELDVVEPDTTIMIPLNTDDRAIVKSHE